MMMHYKASSAMRSLSFYFFCRVAFEKLNGSPIHMDLRAISPEDATAVSFGSRGQYRAYAFATTHRVPSQGYAIAAIRQGDRLIDRGTVRYVVVFHWGCGGRYLNSGPYMRCDAGGLLDELRHLSTKDIQQLKRQGGLVDDMHALVDQHDMM